MGRRKKDQSELDSRVTISKVNRVQHEVVDGSRCDWDQLTRTSNSVVVHPYGRDQRGMYLITEPMLTMNLDESRPIVVNFLRRTEPKILFSLFISTTTESGVTVYLIYLEGIVDEIRLYTFVYKWHSLIVRPQ